MANKMKKTLKFIVPIFLLLVLVLPLISHAALVPCGNDPTGPSSETSVANPCDFGYFIEMINGIINWIISIAGVIFAISLIYGGFLYITSGGDSGKKSKANDIMWNTLKGFVIILVAWLIVYTLLDYLVTKDGTANSIFKFIGGR
jgi:hypothetical protein